MAEINDAELEVLRRSHNVLMKLNGDPKSRGYLETGLKVHFPDVVTEEEAGQRLVAPQLEAFKAEVVAPLTNALNEFNESRKAEQERTATQQLTTTFDELKASRGFTDDGIERVKKLMVERNIADPLAAAALFAEQNPPASQEAPGFMPSHWNIDQTVTDIDVKGLFENEDKWADNMAVHTLNEIRVGANT